MNQRGGGGDGTPEAEARTTVLVVEARPVIRDALTALLRQHEDLAVVSASSLEEGIRAAAHDPPDVVVMDIPAPADAKAVRRLASAAHPPGVLVLSDFTAPEHVGRALEAGAQGFVSRREATEILITGIRSMRAKRRYMCPMVLDLYLRSTTAVEAATPRPSARDRVTRREREVLELISQGQSDRQIGVKLGLSVKTVHTYRTRVMEKLDVHSVALLVRRAIQLGLVPP